MLRGMRTTVSISDVLYARAEQRARRDGQPMTALVEEALRRELDRRDASQARRPSATLAPASGVGGLQASVDLSNSAALLVMIEER